MDIKSAFRLLPLHPLDFGLMGMLVEGMFFVDKALPFGCSSSCPPLFEKFSTFLEWCMKQANFSCDVIHYLDEFRGGGASRSKLKQCWTVCYQLFAI